MRRDVNDLPIHSASLCPVQAELSSYLGNGRVRLIVKLKLLVVSLFLSQLLVTNAADSAGPITVAFGQHCERLLINTIHAAHKEIQAAIYEFTKKDIAEALIERAEHGVKVTIKIDAQTAEYKSTAELITRLQQAKITVLRIKMPPEAKMHNKFIVIDGRWVLTGSYNWTKLATDENWENLIAIESPALAADYAGEWERIKSER